MAPKTTVTTEERAVAQAVIERLGVRDSRGRTPTWWAVMFHETGWSRLEPQLTLAEWHEFLRLCSEAGVSRSDEERQFRSMIKLLSRHGNDGYGDRPADVTRIVYWFLQHVDNIPEPRMSRSRSPRRT